MAWATRVVVTVEIEPSGNPDGSALATYRGPNVGDDQANAARETDGPVIFCNHSAGGGVMFLNRLLGHERGIVVCCNILDGLDEGLYRENFVRELFDWWQAFCTHADIKDPILIIHALRDLAFDPLLGNLPPEFRADISRPQFSFMPKRKIGTSPRNSVSQQCCPQITCDPK